MFSAIAKKDRFFVVRAGLAFQASAWCLGKYGATELRRSQQFQARRRPYSAQKYQQCADSDRHPQYRKIDLTNGRDDSPHSLQYRLAELAKQTYSWRIAARSNNAGQPVEQKREKINAQRQI